MNTNELIEKIEKACDIDSGTMALEDALETCGYWDSMSYIIFMSMAQQELGIKAAASDVQKCKTVADLVGLCKSGLDD